MFKNGRANQMEEKEKHSERPKLNIWQTWAIVIVLALIYGLGTRAIFGGSPFNGTGLELNVVSLSFIFGMPVGIGALTAFFVGDKYWRGLVLTIGLMAFVLGLTVLMAFEVWICVLMAAVPMLIIAGGIYLIVIFAIWLWNRFASSDEKPKRMNVFALFAFLLVPYIFAPIEAQFKTPELYRTVEDSILISSSPE